MLATAETFRHLCFFFLHIPPPPISTLFPYTTLFRSWRYRAWILQNHRDKWLWKRPAAASAKSRSHRSEEHTSEPSHLGISYAVFCLKKKKQGKRQPLHKYQSRHSPF